MRIRSFRAKNYKSLRETPTLSFDAGINVIVGPNNVGKTALLEALSGSATATPHRSEATHRSITDPDHGAITFEFGFDIDHGEFVDLCTNHVSEPVFVYVPNPTADYQTRALELFSRPTLRFTASIILNSETRPTHGVVAGDPMPPGNVHTVQLLTRGRATPVVNGTLNATIGHPNFIENQAIAPFLSRRYLFRAERLNVHRHAMGTAVELSPNASNLAEVLDNLQSNPTRYQRYIRYVQRIFPHVHDVRTVSVQNGEKEIRVWMAPVETERSDLSFPLNNCGTGIGQVLAMLYVVLNSPLPRVLIIDEPNSFLHPGAVRELVRIFDENQRHQYIVSTHSPAVADAIRPTAVHVVTWANGQTHIASADVREIEAQRLILKEVGASFGDVFGADRVLWVEGKTEEVCFPRLLTHFNKLAARTSILGVINTGDFQRKDVDRVIGIYERLSKGVLMPEKVAFMFDREERTPAETANVSRRCGGRVHFTGARMFENYLLHPEAVCALLRDEFAAAGISWDAVDLAAVTAAMPQDPANANGAKVLSDLFDSLSEGRVRYEKVKHGAALLDHVLRLAPEQLESLAQEAAQALEPS